MSDDLSEIPDIDRDSLHILPLAIIPLQTPALRRARLIKNVRLDSVLELFESGRTGSGQLDVESVPRALEWPEIPIHPDLKVLRKLAKLPSFDVYSLRVHLRELGIPVNSSEALKLSPAKNRELMSYMTTFTRPLIVQIYGTEDLSVQSFEDLIDLFRQPDVKKAVEKLKMMARRLEIKTEDVPKFLEDYGDIFLSLSYFRSCLEHITPIVGDFLEWLDDLMKNRHFRQEPNLMKTCAFVQATLNESMAAVSGRLEDFDNSTKDLWENVSAARFRQVESLIRSYHTAIGGVLCALTVKIEGWARTFPHKNSGGPQKRAEFIMADLRQGIEKIQHIEGMAPMRASLR
jgi:hypothetical protein